MLPPPPQSRPPPPVRRRIASGRTSSRPRMPLLRWSCPSTRSERALLSRRRRRPRQKLSCHRLQWRALRQGTMLRRWARRRPPVSWRRVPTASLRLDPQSAKRPSGPWTRRCPRTRRALRAQTPRMSQPQRRLWRRRRSERRRISRRCSAQNGSSRPRPRSFESSESGSERTRIDRTRPASAPPRLLRPRCPNLGYPSPDRRGAARG